MDLYSDAQRFPATLRGDGKVVLAADLAGIGVSRSAATWRADHGRIARVFRGAYVVGAVSLDLADRARAALAVCGASAAIGFHTAAALWGFGVVPHPAIHIVVPAGTLFPTHRGIRVHQSVVPLEPVLWNGIPCTPPARAAIDIARGLDRTAALPVLDAALASGRCDHDSLLAEVARHRGLKGVRRVRDLVGVADGRSQCRQETQLRLFLHDAGLTEFVPQVAVMDDWGEVRYCLDLADLRRRVAAEYDGSSHLDRGRLRDDRERHNWLEERGWRMRYFTDRDLYQRRWRIVPTLRAAQRGR